MTFDAGEGTFDDGKNEFVSVLKDSRGLREPDDPSIDDPLKIFSHWEKNGVPFDFSYDLILSDMTLDAVYEDAYTVYFDPGEGYWYAYDDTEQKREVGH